MFWNVSIMLKICLGNLIVRKLDKESGSKWKARFCANDIEGDANLDHFLIKNTLAVISLARETTHIIAKKTN